MDNSNQQQITDKTLIKRVLGDDAKAFGLIIKNTERLVAQIVSKMIRNPDDRKDIAQEVYLKAFHNLHKFQHQAKLSTWIAHIAYNSCTDYLRKKRIVLFSDLDLEKDPEDAENKNPLQRENGYDFLHQKDISRILDLEIDKLPPLYRTLINLYHQQELSYLEIEAITEIPMGTIKNYLFRARKILKANLLSQYKKDDL